MGEPYGVKTRGIGLPDYAQPKPIGGVPIGPVYTLSDLGELAARLGSPVTFDRRGNVIWYDSFEGGMSKSGAWGGVGGSFEITNARARTGECSVHITTGLANYGEVVTWCTFSALTNFGGEASFIFPEWGEEHYQLMFTIYDGTYLYYPHVRWNTRDAAVSPNTLFYYTDTGVWAPFGQLVLPYLANEYLFNTVKLVVDTTNNRYIRFIANGMEYDLSAYTLRGWPAVNPPHIELIFRIYSPGWAVHTYVDDLIITQNEPENAG